MAVLKLASCGIDLSLHAPMQVPCQDSRISFQKSQHSEEQEEEICTDVSDSSAMKTDTSTKLENSGLSIVTVDSRQQIEVPQMPTLPRSVRSLISDRVSCVNTTIPSVLQQNLQPPSRKPNEIVKVVPSRTVNPIIHTSHSTSTPTGFKVGVSGTQSGTVQVIDLTRRDLSDTLVSRNGLAAAPSVSQTRSLQIGGTSRLRNEAGVNSVGTVKALGKSKDLVSSIITRNGSTSSGKGTYIYTVTYMYTVPQCAKLILVLVQCIYCLLCLKFLKCA